MSKPDEIDSNTNEKNEHDFKDIVTLNDQIQKNIDNYYK